MNIVRILHVYNEVDIIRQNLEWYINDGIETIILDEGSNDGTYEICQSYLGKGVIKIDRILRQEYDAKISFKLLWGVVSEFNPKFVILADADEFFESSIVGESLLDFLSRQISQGYNIFNLHSCEFWMTEKDDNDEKDFFKRITHYSYFASHLYRIFKFDKRINIWDKIGHAPIFPNDTDIKICPIKLISRHYKFRSLKQGYAKIERIKPIVNSDYSFHYIKFKKQPNYFIINSSLLTKYNEDKNWNLQRTFSGFRMTYAETINYLGLNTMDDLLNWFKSRTFEQDN
jgi:hypothetical protein